MKIEPGEEGGDPWEENQKQAGEEEAQGDGEVQEGQGDKQESRSRGTIHGLTFGWPSLNVLLLTTDQIQCGHHLLEDLQSKLGVRGGPRSMASRT